MPTTFAQLAADLNQASTADGSATAKTASSRIERSHANMFRPVPNRRDARRRTAAPCHDRSDVRERQGPGLVVPVAAGKNQTRRLVSASVPAIHVHPASPPRRHARHDCLAGRQVKQPAEESTTGRSQKSRSGRTISPHDQHRHQRERACREDRPHQRPRRGPASKQEYEQPVLRRPASETAEADTRR